MVLEESAPTMEELTDDEMKEWKEALALNQPEDTDDKEQQGVVENEETDKNATEYYKCLFEKAGHIVQLFTNGSGFEEIKTTTEALDTLIFPHVKDATSKAKTALEKFRSSLQKASGVSEEYKTVLDKLTDTEIDAQMTPLELGLLASSSTSALGIRELTMVRLKSQAETHKAQAKAQAELHKAQAETHKAQAENALTLLLNLALKVHMKTDVVDSLLGQMATLSQADNTLNKGTADVRDQSRRQRNLEKKAEVQYRRESDQVFPRWQSSELQKLYDEAKLVPEKSPFHKSSLRSLWKGLDENTKTSILGIHNSYNTFINDSTILDRPGATAEETATNSRRPGEPPAKRTRRSAGTFTTTSTSTQEEYKERIKESTKILTKLFRRSIDGQSEESDADRKTHFPGPRGQEVHGAQPFFGSLLDAISCVAEVAHKNKFTSHMRRTGSSAVESPKQDPNGSEEASDKQVRSPPKNTCEKESAVQGGDGRFRFGDFVIKKSGCHIWVYRADTLPIVIEINAFYRNDKAWEDLIINAVQQVLNHTSRYVRVGLNFAGAGVASHATGAIGSLAYIQVYVLELKNPGTKEPSLAIVKSKLLPLMKKDTFSKWIKTNHRDDESDKVKPEEAEKILFPVTNDEDERDADPEEVRKPAAIEYNGGDIEDGAAANSEVNGDDANVDENVNRARNDEIDADLEEDRKPAARENNGGDIEDDAADDSDLDDGGAGNDTEDDDDSVPFGLLTMFQLMMSSKSELFGQTRTSDDDLQLLASGAFGNVFLARNDDDSQSVVKLSRHGRRAYLRAEGFAYKAVGHLGEGKRPFAHLAVALSRDATVSVGTITTTMPSLVITPVGKPLVHLGDISKNEELLYNVVFDVALALQHMHKRNVAHNDVSLANVVVVSHASGRAKAVLVDLSLACPFTFEIPFFCGNPVYVHRDVHNDKPWEPRPFHDMAALGLLAAVLTSGSIVPWLGFSSPVRDASPSYKDRYQVAIKAIEKLPNSSCRSQIKDWINLDKKETILRSPCSCGKNGKKKKIFCATCKCAKNRVKCLDECSCKKNKICTNLSSFPKFKAPNLQNITYQRP
jgi:hypothetical protein